MVPTLVVAGASFLGGMAASAVSPAINSSSKSRLMSDVARARSTSTNLAQTLPKCRSWGFARGKADAIAGRASDPSGAVAGSDVIRDVSDLTFRKQCAEAILAGYTDGYAKFRVHIIEGEIPGEKYSDRPKFGEGGTTPSIASCSESGSTNGKMDALAGKPANTVGAYVGKYDPDFLRACSAAYAKAYMTAYEKFKPAKPWQFW